MSAGIRLLLLTPGLMAAVADSKVTTREVNVESYISWTRDQFSFSEERLEDLLKKISRWYDVEFVFDDEEIKDYKFSGFYAQVREYRCYPANYGTSCKCNL